MKAIIKNVTWQKEYGTKYGPMQLFKVEYNDKVGYYSSKKKDQTSFIKDKEAEFTEEEKIGSNGVYITIKPAQTSYNKSPYQKAVKKEQSKYSGFAVSYVKDLIIAGKIDIGQMEQASKKLFNLMVELDKSIEV